MERGYGGGADYVIGLAFCELQFSGETLLWREHKIPCLFYIITFSNAIAYVNIMSDERKKCTNNFIKMN